MATAQPHPGLETSDCSLECWAARITAAERLRDSKMELPEEPWRNCATVLLAGGHWGGKKLPLHAIKAREGPDF